MRDLRAELLEREEDLPVEWHPVEGDILVGSVRDGRSSETTGAVIVEEERTGLPVLVNLDSPHLAALFDLHNPRERDRVGIKFTGRGPDGASRFTMIIDRAETSEIAPESPFLPDSTPDYDDSSAATPEEREYISQMLSGAPDEGPDGDSEDPIAGLLRRQQDELNRQARTLERLESMIAPTDVTDEADSDQAQPPQDSLPKRGPTWLRALALWILVFLSAAIGSAAAVLFKPSIQTWLGW